MRIATSDYRALAELRYRIRLFLSEGDAAARRVGLEPQQYLLLLAVRGLPEGTKATIQAVAERLALKHNSTVELIDRLETRGYVSRIQSREDRRNVLLKLLPRGDRLVERVARERLTELRSGGEALSDALDTLLGRNPSSRRVNKSGQRSRMSHVKSKKRGKNREQR
jgi:DNA-binding MarR family transcriptional regulator